jgi:hypothetical protein
MAIRHVITRGYGNGTFNGTIAEVVARGYIDTAAATGTIGGKIAFTETEIVDGTEVTTITLVNDTWVTTGATFDAQRQNIIDGFDSAQVEATGWNAEVRDKEVVGAVVRTSDTLVTITWTASPLYDVTADEVITATIPATSLTGGVAVNGTPTIGVTADVEPVVDTDQPSGGYGWVRYEQEQLRRKAGKKAAQRKRRKARKIKDEIDRQLALVERGIEEKDARVSELTRLTKLVDQNRGMVSEAQDKKLDAIADKAIETYSIASMEHLERAIKHSREEQLFFELATMILLEQ